jgi:hypothetical protein
VANETIDLNELRAGLDEMTSKYGPQKSWAEGIPATPLRMCRNANSAKAWYCYHYAGTVTPGKESVNAADECEACAKVSESVETLPNFMTDESCDD